MIGRLKEESRNQKKNVNDLRRRLEETERLRDELSSKVSIDEKVSLEAGKSCCKSSEEADALWFQLLGTIEQRDSLRAKNQHLQAGESFVGYFWESWQLICLSASGSFSRGCFLVMYMNRNPHSVRLSQSVLPVISRIWGVEGLQQCACLPRVRCAALFSQERIPMPEGSVVHPGKGASTCVSSLRIPSPRRRPNVHVNLCD